MWFDIFQPLLWTIPRRYADGKGPYLKDVRKIFGILDPLLPVSFGDDIQY